MREARILAFQGRLLGFRGGLVLGDDDDDRRLRHTRYREPVDSFDLSSKFNAALVGHYAYGGMTHNHFGHLMAEMIHRVLPSMLVGQRQKFIFVSARNHPTNNFSLLPGHVQQVYSLLGLNAENVEIVTRNTIVESLFVSESGSDLGGGPWPEYLDILDAYTERRLDSMFGSARTGKRLYVSRSKLPIPGALAGERYLEAALEAEGYEIFHPQAHPVAVQMDQYRKADVVIFLEGSACHGAELLGRNAIKNCILLYRRREMKWFDRVLQPRSRQYTGFVSTSYLGTIFGRARRPSMYEKGLFLADWDLLTEFLRNTGAAQLRSTSKDAYLAAAKTDFAKYVEYTPPARAYSKNTDLVRSFVDQLTTFDASFAGAPKPAVVPDNSP
jgi:hypothetical protein